MEEKGRRRIYLTSVAISGKGSCLGICTKVRVLLAYSLSASPAPPVSLFLFLAYRSPAAFQSSGMLSANPVFTGDGETPLSDIKL